MKRSTPLVAAITGALLLGLAACGSAESSTTNGGDPFQPGFYESDAPGEPTRGGTLTIADFAEGRSLDPTRVFPTGFSGGSPLLAIYDQLIRWNEREQAFEPRLAESVEPNDDYTRWTITLREGVQFSDGTPVNADAVIGSFDYYLTNQGFDLGVVAPLWAGAEKVDDVTVVVNLQDSWSTFPFALGMGMGFIVAPAAIENGPDAFEPIGAGAFLAESYKPAEEMVLTPNPTHWNGAPYLDQLRFVWLGSDETKYDSFRAGSVHAAVMRDLTVIDRARGDETAGWVRTESLGNVININLDEDRPGSNADVRKAIAFALDEEAIYERAHKGLGNPSKHLFAVESRWHDTDANTPEHDPDVAREHLEAAEAAGFDGRVELVSAGDRISRDQALAITAQLEAVGFTVDNVHTRTVADLTSRVFIEQDFDFARSALSSSEEDPYWRLFESFHSESWGNVTGYASSEMDALIEELRETSGDDRRPVLEKIETLFLEDIPTLSLSGNPTFVAWTDDVHGVLPSNDAMIAFDKAWIAN